MDFSFIAFGLFHKSHHLYKRGREEKKKLKITLVGVLRGIPTEKQPGNEDLFCVLHRRGGEVFSGGHSRRSRREIIGGKLRVTSCPAGVQTLILTHTVTRDKNLSRATEAARYGDATLTQCLCHAARREPTGP